MSKANKLFISKNFNFILLIAFPIFFLTGTFILEIAVALISINFLIYSYLKKDWKWLKQTEFKILFIFYLYLLFNLINSLEPLLSFNRSIFFFKFIIFIYAVKEILIDEKKKNKIFFFWLLTIIFISLDVNLEFFTGKNILGNSSEYQGRIASFLNKELKIGSFLYSIYLPVFAYFLIIYKKKHVFFYVILFGVFFIFFSIILTGEKSTTIKAFFCFFVFLVLIQNYISEKKFIIIFLSLMAIFFYFKRNNFLITKPIIILYQTEFNISQYLKKNLHGSHYDTAWKIFKNYPFFGIGIKNFRIECNKEIYYNPNFDLSEYRCSTHPHQVYLEFLSELGIFGFIIFFCFLGNILFRSFYIYKKNNDIVLLSLLLFICATFIPLIPTGSFFTSFNASLFWLNISILLTYINKK